MNDKSHVSLEQHVCLVCGTAFDTGAILLDKRLRASMGRHTATGWGLCPEHQKLSDDGSVALVECDPQRSGSQAGGRMKPEQAYRTGRLAHLRRTVFAQVFNVPIADEQACVFVEPGVIEQLQSMTAPAAADRAALPSVRRPCGGGAPFSAAPVAGFFAPAALRASLASRESPAGYPCRAMLGAPSMQLNRLRRIGNTNAAKAVCPPQKIHSASPRLHGRPRPRNMAGRAVVLRIEPPAASRPLRASIVPSLRSADAYSPASSFGPARFACRAVST